MKSFKLTNDHIKLLGGMFFFHSDDWEYGGPMADCKRPFGNSGRTQILFDMAAILGIDKSVIYDENKEEIKEDEARRLEKIYEELATALQCVLQSKSFEPGEFYCSQYSSEWKKVTKPAPSAGNQQQRRVGE